MGGTLTMPLPDPARAHRNELLIRAGCFLALMLSFALLGEWIRP